MATIFDVAKYILQIAGEMSTWKLQKLCYYSQAWSLAWTEKPLFNEDFQAWANGPVCPELFRVHRKKFIVDASDIPGDVSNLTPDEIDTIQVVLNDYGDMEPYELRELSHKEDPWRLARKNLCDDDYSQETITKAAIGKYYGGL